jgi:hypothetical protein
MHTEITVDLKTLDEDYIITSKEQLIKAFTLWNRRMGENAGDYLDPDDHFIDCITYPEKEGVCSADYLVSLLKELNENPDVATTH